MKIINRKEFLNLPSGTLFSKYSPCYFLDLSIKDESLIYEEDTVSDFFYSSIQDAIDCDSSDEFFNKLEDSKINKTSVNMDFDTITRDGLYEQEQLFAVWEKCDVLDLIKKLNEILGEGYSE